MVCLRNNRSSGLGGWQRWRSQWSCDKEGRDEGQSTSREEEATQRVRDALEEHETCGTPYTCVCVCVRGGWRVQGSTLGLQQDPCTQMPSQHPHRCRHPGTGVSETRQGRSSCF